MKRLPDYSVLPLLLVLLASNVFGQTSESDPLVQGKPLSQWTGSVHESLSGNELEATVNALSVALSSDDNETRVAAADALTVLGPKAKKALPDLIEQLGHEAPWVRVASMAAIASMGKEAMPALMDTFQNEMGGPRVRAAFVMGSIGPDAEAALPLLEAAYTRETPVMQDRLMGILSSIAPGKYGQKDPSTGAAFDPAKAMNSLAADAMAAGDWPGFHGLRRDALCRETGLLTEWPQEGPPMLWRIDGLGRGYSSVAIVGTRLYTMGDVVIDGEEERQCVIAYDLAARRFLWKTAIGAPHEDGGPRCTPTIDGNHAYVMSTDGVVCCLDIESGDLVWSRDLVADFGGLMMSVWKFSESPLIDGDRVICTPGTPEAALVALDKHTGETLWRTSLGDLGDKGADGAGYSSAVIAEIAGVRQYVQLLGRGVVGVEAETGRLLWSYNTIANTVANVTSPIVRGDYVFVTTAYNTGAALLQIVRDGDRFDAQEVYFIEPRDFQNHHGGVVLVGDHVYGGHGANRSDPACIELATGDMVWKERSPSRGSAGVLYVDGHLIFRYDRGEVVLIEATPEGLNLKGRFETPVAEGPAWSHPVVHQGRLYIRHADILCCYDLREVK